MQTSHGRHWVRYYGAAADVRHRSGASAVQPMRSRCPPASSPYASNRCLDDNNGSAIYECFNLACCAHSVWPETFEYPNYKMVDVKKYHLPPTSRMPNSPLPLIHYPGLLKSESDGTPSNVYNLLSSNGWQPRWLVRYGPTQWSHYHSTVHECMVVLSGSATLRFGVADIDVATQEGTSAPDQQEKLEVSNDPPVHQEDGGIEVSARAGDVFVLPAGLAHKTFNPHPSPGFKLLAPADIHTTVDCEIEDAMKTVELSGFTMLGAYPKEEGDWDFAIGGESEGKYEQVWSVAKPENDPVLGKASEGICGLWT